MQVLIEVIHSNCQGSKCPAMDCSQDAQMAVAYNHIPSAVLYRIQLQPALSDLYYSQLVRRIRQDSGS